MADSIKLDIQEKSIFERAIIEAFKQYKVSEVSEKLNIAISELPLYIEETKKLNTKEKGQHFILNSNIIDKIGRIIERNYININILISKIFEILLTQENLNLLSDNSNILISLSNQIMTILEIIKSCDNIHELTEKAINYMKYLLDNSEKFLSSEQAEIIQNLEKQLASKIANNALIDFRNNYFQEIVTLCRGESAEEKEKGIENLNAFFYKLNSLNEQFDLLCLVGEDIIKGIISKPNPALINTYYKLSYFFLSFLYNFLYKIKLSPYENDINANVDENITKLNEQYYILDSMEENLEIPENLYVTKFHGKEYRNMKIVNQTLYELDEVKKILLKHTSIFTLAISILNCLILFEDSFKAQFACFLILKRLYFIFPKYRDEIADLIVTNLINLISFDEKIIKDCIDIFEPFLIYLLQNGDENIKNKLKVRLQKKKETLKKDYLNIENDSGIDKTDVESDIIYISNFNLNIGCPMDIYVGAGDEEEKLISVKNPNSLLYIAFNLTSYDINFHLIKYCPNINFSLQSTEKGEAKVQFEDHKFFYEIFRLDKSKGAKMILLIKNPGIYKIIFDNKYSWFTNKSLRYRCTLMKEFNNLGLSSINSNDDIKIEKKDSNEINDNANNEENKKEDEKMENIDDKNNDNNNNVKIQVKFSNNSNIPNYNLDEEDLNQLDVEIK